MLDCKFLTPTLKAVLAVYLARFDVRMLLQVTSHRPPALMMVRLEGTIIGPLPRTTPGPHLLGAKPAIHRGGALEWTFYSRQGSSDSESWRGLR